MVLLFALNLYFITRIQQSPSPPLWIGYALSGVLLLYSHGLAIVYLAVLNAFFLSNPTALTRKMLATWALANVCILLAFSPWLLIYLKQVASFQHQTTIGKPGIAAILSTLVLLVSFPPPNASFLPGSLRSFGSTVLPLIQCAWVISAAFLFGLPLKNIKQRPFPILSLYLLCLLPFILIVTFSHLAQSLYLDRLFLICIVPLALLFGSNLSTAAPLPARLAVFLLCIYGIVSLFCLQTYYLRDWKEDYRSATEFLVANARPGDVVIFVAHVGELHFDWYSKGRRPDLIKMGLPEGIYERGEPEPGLFVKSSSDLTRLCSSLLT